MKFIKTLLGLGALLAASSALAGKCTVTEYVRLPVDSSGNVLYIGALGVGQPSQQVTYTTTTKTGTALLASTNYVRIYCDTEARIAAGDTTVTAVPGSTGLPAGGWEYFFVPKVLNAAGVEQNRYIAIYDGTS